MHYSVFEILLLAAAGIVIVRITGRLYAWRKTVKREREQIKAIAAAPYKVEPPYN